MPLLYRNMPPKLFLMSGYHGTPVYSRNQMNFSRDMSTLTRDMPDDKSKKNYKNYEVCSKTFKIRN